MNRKHPRKVINIRKSTVDYLDHWLEDKHISRTGLLEELALALAIEGGQTRFFKIECIDLKGMAKLHPSTDKAWSVMRDKVKEVLETMDHDPVKGSGGRFYEECQSVGVSKRQANSILKEISRNEKEEKRTED